MTSTPTSRRTRSRSSTTPATTNLESDTDPARRRYSFERPRPARSTTSSPTPPPWPMVTGRRRLGHQRRESVAYQYSRYNYNVTQFFDAANPFARLGPQPRDRRPRRRRPGPGRRPDPRHQRLPRPDRQRPDGTAAGAAVMAGAVKQLRAENPNTVFAAAGDLIGASTFESFIQNDKPTIDALNEAGLEVSAVGNHEFDKGYDDLVDRVMAPTTPRPTRDGGAEWKYLGANVEVQGRRRPDALDGTWIKDIGRRPGRLRRRGHRAPARARLARAASRRSRSPTSSTRPTTAADDLKADGRRRGRDAGARGCARRPTAPPWTTTRRPTSASIIDGRQRQRRRHRLRPHPPRLQLLLPGRRAGRGRAVTERPVVSAGQYGANLNRLRLHGRHGDRSGRRPSRSRLARRSRPVRPRNYPSDAGHRRRSSTPRWPRPTSSVRAELGEIGGAVQPRQARRRHHREPRWRVDAGQPGGRGPALGHRDPRGRRGRDRVHEPRRPARRHGRHRHRRRTRGR